MKTELFILCDAATESVGKLNILGTFDTINAHEAPAVHPQCAIAVRLRVERFEAGQHTLRVNIVDADGAPVIPPLDASFRVELPEVVSSQALNLILNLQRLKFERFGDYSIDLTIDGRASGQLPLFVRQLA